MRVKTWHLNHVPGGKWRSTSFHSDTSKKSRKIGEYQELSLPWFGNQSGGETVKPWVTWLVESDRKLRDGTGWWRNLSVRRVWLLPGSWKNFQEIGMVKGGIWSNWSGIFFFAFVGPLVDEFDNRSSHDQDQVIKATLTVNYKKLMNLGFGFIKPSPFEVKRMDQKRESKSKILKSSSSLFFLGRKKWDPPNPSWILEGLNHLFASLEAINSRWGLLGSTTRHHFTTKQSPKGSKNMTWLFCYVLFVHVFLSLLLKTVLATHCFSNF